MPRSEAYRKTVDLTVKLHEAMKIDPDGEEADAIRDDLDGPWLQMSDDERRVAERVSGDLYTLTEPQEEVAPDAPSMLTLHDAMTARAWDTVLDVLAQHPALVHPIRAAVTRACAYAGLEEPELARMFAEHAVKLSQEHFEKGEAVCFQCRAPATRCVVDTYKGYPGGVTSTTFCGEHGVTQAERDADPERMRPVRDYWLRMMSDPKS